MQPKQHAENVSLSWFVDVNTGLVENNIIQTGETIQNDTGTDLLSGQQLQQVEIINLNTGSVIESTWSSSDLSEQDERDLKKILDSLIEQ